MSTARDSYDVVVVGGGHNGLVAAAYLARASLSVVVLERLGHVGGAAVSVQAFSGHDARLSRYADLVSLLPDRIVEELELDIAFTARTTASYTPTLRDGKPGGLLVEHPAGPATAASFEALTGGTKEYDAWREFHADVADLAHVVAPTLLSPLPTEREIRERVDPGIWRDLVTTPLGETIESRFTDDTVRGLVAAPALIGTFASMHEPSLIQNRCLLYHLIGNGTGEERVPVGGMGAVTASVARAAQEGGAEIVLGAGVSAIRGGDDGAEVSWHDGTTTHTISSRFVLGSIAPWVLRILMGEPDDHSTKPAGAQIKINFLLHRLPALKSGLDPAVAFAGDLHLGEDYPQLEAAYAEAAAGEVPTVLPGEFHCHSLSDPTILGGAALGTHTLTYFGRHLPAALFDTDPLDTKGLAVSRVIAQLNEHLVDPIEACVATDADGQPCIEAKIPQEVEADLAMPGGHIFHGDLDWPWAPNRALLDTPARQWGVQTDLPSVLVCGSGARRGGAVSGIGGHNAAQAVLANLGG